MDRRFSVSPVICQVAAADPHLERFNQKGHTQHQRTLLTENKMLRYQYKIANTEADTDKTSGSLCRQNRGGDKMVSSFIQDTAQFTLLLSQREIHRPHFSNTTQDKAGESKQHHFHGSIVDDE